MYVPMGFFGGLAVKNLLAKQETWVPSWDLEDPLEKEMVTDDLKTEHTHCLHLWILNTLYYCYCLVSNFCLIPLQPLGL